MRDDFGKMDKKKKAEYINDILSEGKSFKDIYNITMQNNELAQSREILLNKFRNAGYKINEENKAPQHDKTLARQIAAEFKTELNQFDDSTANQLKTILQSADDIIQMAEWWKKYHAEPALGSDRLSIQVPGGDVIRKTIRINDQVWEQWKEFCGRQPEYSEKDLFARALLFYMDQGK